MSENKNMPSWDDVGKILLIVIVILVFWWWRSDQGRVKYIHELEKQIEEYEEKIGVLESEVEGLR